MNWVLLLAIPLFLSFPSAPWGQKVFAQADCTGVTLSPNPMNLLQGQSGTLYVTSVDGLPLGSSVIMITFSSLDELVATVSPTSIIPPAALQTTVTARVSGAPTTQSVVITAMAHLDGPAGSGSCQGTVVVNVFASSSWFQTQGGDVSVKGNILSQIPATAPDQNFSLGQDGYPGVVSYGGLLNPNFGLGSVSSTGWLANSAYGGERYDYDFFLKRAPALKPLDNNPSQSDLNALDGFYLVGGDGNLTIPQANIWNVGGDASDRTVVIFVPGDLTIRARIRLPADQNNFLAIIVQGDINIEGDVYDPSLNNPAVEGVYLANGSISTGSEGAGNDHSFTARGIFVAWGDGGSAFNLERNLSDDEEEDTPAESFTYDVNLLMNALKIKELMPSSFVWEEVAP